MAGIHFAYIENGLPDPFWDAPPPYFISFCLASDYRHHLSTPSSYHYQYVTSLPNQDRISKSPRHPPSWFKHMLWSAFTFGLPWFSLFQWVYFFFQCTHPPQLWRHFLHISWLLMFLQLNASNTHQYRQGSLLMAPSGHSICAVQAVCKYIHVALHSATNEAPLYVYYVPTWLEQKLHQSLRIGVSLHSSVLLIATGLGQLKQ